MSESRELVSAGAASGAVATLGAPSAVANDRLDLTESLNFFWRQYKLILTVAGVILAAGLLYALVAPKTYTATSTVMITSDPDEAVQTDATTKTPTQVSNEFVNTQAEVIASRDMATRVADALGLTRGLNAEQRRDVIDELRKNTSVSRSGKTYALNITSYAPDAKAAAHIANEYARQFTNWELSADQKRNDQERALLEHKLAQLRQQAQSDTQALQQYRIANNLPSTTGASLTEQEISTYNEQVTKARADAAEAQARLQTAMAQLRSGSTGDDVGEALDSPVISTLRAQEAAAASDVADLSARYGPNYPALISARSKLAAIRLEIQDQINRVISNLRAQQEVTTQRLASLTGSLAAARAKLSQNNVAMVGLSELERTADASQGIYETYLNRYKKLLAASGSEKPQARIITLADIPLQAESPNLKLVLALSLVIGLGLGVLAAYVREALSHVLTTPEDVERSLREPYLASIPLLSSVDSANPHPVTAVQSAPKSVFTESFRLLGAAIDQTTHGAGQVIAITSALPDEGKTVMSCCLAQVLATEGKRTMLIDCDLRRGGISRLLDMGAHQKGLIEVLEGTTPLKLDQLAGDHVFCVLPLRPSEDEPEHLLTGQPFIDLLDELRGRFDRIILDLPPVLPIAASRILASRADAVVMAARWRKTSTFAMKAALRRLPPDRVNLVGVALSQVDMRRRAFFNHADPSFYYRQYQGYYA